MVKISDQELLDELERCYEEHGKVTATILNNSSNDYPTQPTYNNRFGSLSTAMDKVNIEQVDHGRKIYTREDIINKSIKFYDNNGNIKVSDFSNTRGDLPSASIMYNYFDGIDDLLKEAGIYEDVIESRRDNRREISKRISKANEKYTDDDREELIEHIQFIAGKHGKATTQTISNEDGPSKHAYDKIFGSLSEARLAAGLEEQYVTNFEDKLGLLPDNFDEDADAHIYVLSIHDDSERYYYVGKSTRLRKRLNAHTSGKSKIRHRTKHKYGRIKNMSLTPDSLLRVINVYQKDSESDNEFDNRLSDIEHTTSYKVAAGLETSNILGGR